MSSEWSKNPKGCMYIPPDKLQTLKAYKYRASDFSLLANHVMCHFWSALIQWFPRWLAPNLITLIGFGFIVFGWAAMVAFCPDLEGQAPAWVYAANSICVFVYQTMDALDGKQARRTGSSSPLGELFDHGCDAMTAAFLVLTMVTTLQLGAGWHSFVFVHATLVGFYLAQWEDFHTHCLQLGYINVTEFQWASILIYAGTAYFSPSIWADTVTITVPSLLQPVALSTLNYVSAAWIPLATITAKTGFAFGLAGEGGLSITFLPKDAFLWFSVVMGSVTVFNNLYSVFSKCLFSPRGSEYSHISLYRVVTTLLPLTISFFGAIVWAANSPSDILHTHCHLFLLGLGFLYCNMVGRIIIARIFSMEVNKVLGSPLLVLIGALLGPLSCPPEYELLYLYALAAFYILSYLHFCLSVIHCLCDFLKIRCLVIPTDASRALKKESKHHKSH
eukprot:TRINITY_DN3012_c0_g1_i2.p1 TRINITY_DN3012_c0_g1~~TRINITY_DN3012_c0_g1_i2.p1  ORF type:complete len:446 (+),score=48.58 TRINITY_DN3012_c0_g1_i2:322-1659(+)